MVSTFKFSLTFVVVCALVGFASPLPEPTNDKISVYPPHANNFGEWLEYVQTGNRESLPNLSATLHELFSFLQHMARLTLEEGMENLDARVMDAYLRVETFMMADGSHYAFPPVMKGELEAKYKTKAVTVSKLWMNLRTMKRADTLITEAVKHTIDKTSVNERVIKADKKAIEKYLTTFLHEYFQTLDRLFVNDSEVGVEYIKQLALASEYVKQNPRVNDGFFDLGFVKPEEVPSLQPDIETFLEDKTVFRKAVANRLFLKQAEKTLFMVVSQTQFERFLVVGALLRKAASNKPGADKIEEIYQQALAKAGAVSLNSSRNDISEALFATIEEGLKSEPKLWTEIYDLKKNFEHDTVYDIDTYVFNFALV